MYSRHWCGGIVCDLDSGKKRLQLPVVNLQPILSRCEMAGKEMASVDISETEVTFGWSCLYEFGVLQQRYEEPVKNSNSEF